MTQLVECLPVMHKALGAIPRCKVKREQSRCGSFSYNLKTLETAQKSWRQSCRPNGTNRTCSPPYSDVSSLAVDCLLIHR